MPTTQATRIAVMAGAESIEHGNDLSDDTIRMMAEAGTFLDPTIQCNLSSTSSSPSGNG